MVSHRIIIVKNVKIEVESCDIFQLSVYLKKGMCFFMQEEYLIKKMIQGKTEEEVRIELMQSIIETKEKLKVARCNFEYAEDDMIDYYSYQIKANQAKLDYLIKVAKSKGIVLSRENELKVRLLRNSDIAV